MENCFPCTDAEYLWNSQYHSNVRNGKATGPSELVYLLRGTPALAASAHYGNSVRLVSVRSRVVKQCFHAAAAQRVTTTRFTVPMERGIQIPAYMLH